MNELAKSRFIQKIDVTDLCWNWTSALKKPEGYGLFWLDGETRYAHRVMYEHVHGPVPEGKFVCHTCDNPGCVNPRHLFLGDAAVNSHDARDKRRLASGVKHGRTKLTEEDVAAIRGSDEPYRVLAERYGVGLGTISGVRTGRAWKFVDGAVRPMTKSEAGKIGREIQLNK